VAAVVIPADYSRRLADPVLSGPPEVALVLDGSKPTSAREALNSARGAIEAINMERSLRGERREAEALSPVRPHLRVRYNEEMKESVYTLPSELGQILFAVALVLAGISIARERELGTLEHLMVAPIRRVELIVAKSVPAVLLSYLVFLSMLAVSILVFEVPMRGSWLLLLPISLLFIFIELGIGLMISSYAKNQTQGMLLALMWAMIEFFFSGYGVPVENMPVVLQTIAPIFPIYHYMTIFRAILLKGVGLSAFWPHLAAAFAIGTVVLSVTIWFLGRQEWD
jgi:ABC-2 type transport system permease protein